MTLLSTTWSSGEPQVRVRTSGSTTSRLEPLVGFRLAYRATSGRVCVGHRPFRKPGVDYVDCLQQPVPGSKRCRGCISVEAAFAANLHHAHRRDPSTLDAAVAEHLRQPNLLYLAGFADGSIKVGTTTETRTQQRLSEQGAWLAQIVAEAADGVVVRELEDRVTDELGIAQSVSMRRKLDGLVQQQPESMLTSAIDRMGDAVRRLVDHMGDPALISTSSTWEHPTRQDSAWQSPVRYPFPLSEGAHNLEVRQACGRAVALSRVGSTSDDIFVADIGQLFGVVIEPGAHVTPEITVQDSLF